jgi:RNA polymerase sigma factor (sigma-70 family)
MDDGSTEGILRDLGTLYQVGAAAGLTDAQLLDRFADGGDHAQAAFEAIVRRHGAMVLGVCRRALGDAHAAEDAFQATFLVLASRAGAIRRRESLGPWLHGVASRLARRARLLALRRGASRPLPELAAPEPGRDAAEIRPVLDEELGRLPEKYRRPVVLCYLEGLTQEEAARALGWTKGTVSGRLARAKDLLRGRLTRRGLAPAAGLLALEAGPEAGAAAMAMAPPPSLVASTARVAVAVVLGLSEAGAVPASVLALARGLRRAMLVGRLKGVAALLALGALAGAIALGHAGPEESGRAPIEEAAAARAVAVAEAGRPADPSLPRGARARMGTTHLRHEGSVVRAAFSPDGRTLATAGWDGAVRFWDPTTGAPVTGLDALKESGSPLAVAYSADGRLLAVGREDGTVQLWDVTARRERFRSKVHKGRVQGLAFAPDGLTFASASDEETCVRLWDVATGRELLTLGFDEEAAYLGPIALSPDGNRLALGMDSRTGRASTIRLWDLDGGGEPVVIRKAHDHDLTALAFTRDGRALISGGVKLRPVKDDHGRDTNVVEALPRVYLWNVRDGRKLRELDPAGVVGFGGFDLSRDGATLVSSHQDRLLVWDLDSGRVARTIPIDPDDFGKQRGDLALAPDGRTLAMLRGDCRVRLLDLATGKPLLARPEAHDDAVLSATYTPDGRTLVTSGAEGTVRLWDAASGAPRRAFDLGVRGWAHAACVSPDGRTLAAVGEDPEPGVPDFRGVARLWDLAGGRPLRELKFDHRAIGVRFSPDGWRIAVTTWNAEAQLGISGERGGEADDTVRVFDVASGRRLAELRGHTGKILAVAFAPDGRSLVTASEDMSFRFWEPESGKPTRRLAITGHLRSGKHSPGAPTRITSAAFSPDLKAAVTSGLWDDRLIIWDLTTGEAVRTIRLAKSSGSRLAVSPDGRRFASASATRGNPDGDDDRIRLWDMATGREMLGLPTGGKGVQSLVFAPDGTSLATGMEDSTALVWDFAAADPGTGEGRKP